MAETYANHHNMRAVQHLNDLLYEELFAAETVRQVLAHVSDIRLGAVLDECMHSHAGRATLLRNEIARRGGIPLWRSMTEFVEPEAWANATVAAVAEEEQRRRRDYEAGLYGLDPQTRQFVERCVLPEQLRTCGAVGALNHAAR